MKFIILFEANNEIDRSKIMTEFKKDFDPLTENKTIQNYICFGNKPDAIAIVFMKSMSDLDYYTRRFRAFSKVTVIPAESYKDFPL